MSVVWSLVAVLSVCPPEATQDVPAEQHPARCRLAEQHQAQADLEPLSAIFARPEFQRAAQRNDNVFAVWVARLRHWLEAFFESQGAADFSNVTRVLVLLTAGIAIPLLAARWWRARRKATTSHLRGEAAALNLGTPNAHLDDAARSLNTDPRAAIRHALLALLSMLETHRWATLNRSFTNAEVASRLAARGAPEAIARQVTTLLNWFDGAFYSLGPIAPSAAEKFIAEVRLVVDGAGHS